MVIAQVPEGVRRQPIEMSSEFLLGCIERVAHPMSTRPRRRPAQAAPFPSLGRVKRILCPPNKCEKCPFYKGFH